MNQARSRLGAGRGISPRMAALIILAGVVAAIVVVSLMIYSERSKQENYAIAIQRLNVEAKQITEHYNNEYALWEKGLIDDAEMIEITESVMMNQQRVINMMKSLDVPDIYREAHEYNVKSLEYEYQSNEQFKRYLESRDEEAYKRSQELFQLSFEYEMKALSLYRGNGLFIP
ncbi:MAG: hypothetical protein RMJ59_04185 [Candidatus Nitrosocaldus sp.]|nr:hypothetical protein [Candidatus Nitrosocaldus sp.]MDW8275565.1 hypothetical protein [Candidatus Nitrosocaldus sp.]